MAIKRERSKRGLLVCINKAGEGKLELTLDDLLKESCDATKWSFDGIVSSKEYSEDSFKNLDFDEKELADFGYYIMSRLFAYYKKGDL